MMNDMTDDEVNELITKKTGRYKQGDLIQIPKNKFEIGETVALVIDRSGEEPGVIEDINYSVLSRRWEYSIIISGFVTIPCVDEMIIKKLI